MKKFILAFVFSACTVGSLFAQNELFHIEIKNISFEELKEKADAGSAKHQATLGVMYLTGHDWVYKSTTKAISYLIKAAQQGQELAILYLYKIIVILDFFLFQIVNSKLSIFFEIFDISRYFSDISTIFIQFIL